MNCHAMSPTNSERRGPFRTYPGGQRGPILDLFFGDPVPILGMCKGVQGPGGAGPTSIYRGQGPILEQTTG